MCKSAKVQTQKPANADWDYVAVGTGSRWATWWSPWWTVLPASTPSSSSSCSLSLSSPCSACRSLAPSLSRTSRGAPSTRFTSPVSRSFRLGRTTTLAHVSHELSLSAWLTQRVCVHLLVQWWRDQHLKASISKDRIRIQFKKDKYFFGTHVPQNVS